MDIITYIIAVIYSTDVVITEIRGTHRKSSLDESERRRASRRAGENRLFMELMSASCKRVDNQIYKV